MVFGGTKIGGASNINRADAQRLLATEVADRITGSVTAKQAEETLGTVAEKLLNGKQLAIHHRTSSKTPRFIRQSQVSTERATHTVAVVRNLFAKAGEQIADSTKQRALKEAVDRYLIADTTAIQGGQLGKLVQQLKEAIAEGMAPQNSEALPTAQSEPEQQAISQAGPPGADMPGEPAPQAMNAKLTDDLQGLKAGAANRRPASQKLQELVDTLVPSITLTSVEGKIEHEAQLSEESQPLPAESGQIKRDFELNEELEVHNEAEPPQLVDGLIQDSQREVQGRMSIDPRSRAEAQESLADQEPMPELDASREFDEQPYFFEQRQSSEASSPLSGELLYQRLSVDQDQQFFMQAEDRGSEYIGYNNGHRDSVRGYDNPHGYIMQESEFDEDFDPNVLDSKSPAIGRPPGNQNQDPENPASLARGQNTTGIRNSSTDESIDEIYEDRDGESIDDSEQVDISGNKIEVAARQILANVQEAREANQRIEKWDSFVEQLDAYTELVSAWQSELGIPQEGEAGTLEARPLHGSAGSLRSATNQLKDLLNDYMGQTNEQRQWGVMRTRVGVLLTQLDIGLGELLSKRDALVNAKELFADELSRDPNGTEVYDRDLELTNQIIDDVDLLLLAGEAEVKRDPNPELVAQRQANYLKSVLDDPDTKLSEVKTSLKQLNLAAFAEQQEQLRSLAAANPFDPKNLPRASQIREAMKNMGSNLSRLQAELKVAQEELSVAGNYIEEDYGTSDVSKRMQAQINEKSQEVNQLNLQLNAALASIQKDLKLQVNLAPRAQVSSSTPNSEPLTLLIQSLTQQRNAGDPGANLGAYDSNLKDLLVTLNSTAALNQLQTAQLKELLKPAGRIANQLTNLKDLFVAQITTERDRVINKVMVEHAKRASEAQHLTKEAARKKDSIQESLKARAQKLGDFQAQMKSLKLDLQTLGKYVDLQAELDLLATGDSRRVDIKSQMQGQVNAHRGNQGLLVLLSHGKQAELQAELERNTRKLDELQAQFNTELYGGPLPDTVDMPPETAELATWAAMPLDELEGELKAQNMASQNAQTDELSATKDRDRTLANTRGEAERKVTEVTNSVEYRLQELEQAHAQL